MNVTDGPDSLPVPLFEIVSSIGFGEHGDPRRYSYSSLFWSLVRLFGHYERVLSAVNLPREARPYLEADIENFIIRMRIAQNDVAHLIRQLLPHEVRGLSRPRGAVHPANREMSIHRMSEYLERHPEAFPEFTECFKRARSWVEYLASDRDRIVHYKAKIVVFESNRPSFAFMAAAGTEELITDPDGSKRLRLTDVETFVNDSLLSLHNFMHVDLVQTLQIYARRMQFKMMQAGTNHRMTCEGIRRFRKMNGL